MSHLLAITHTVPRSLVLAPIENGYDTSKLYGIASMDPVSVSEHDVISFSAQNVILKNLKNYK